MVSIMKRSAVIIDEKCRVLQDISVLIAGKKYEQSIMCFLPFLIIVYIDLAMPGIMACLYHNVFGICVMTCLMIIYSVAYMIGRKIMNIEV